jgi:hypothetical protein
VPCCWSATPSAVTLKGQIEIVLGPLERRADGRRSVLEAGETKWQM